MLRLPLFVLLITLISSNNWMNAQMLHGTSYVPVAKLKGIAFTSPSNPFSKDPMPAIADINAEWISILPYAFTPKNKPDVIYNTPGQWWGEKEVGVREIVRTARASGLKCLMKPHVWIHWADWTGHMEFKEKEDWEEWESAYEKYILEFAELSEELKLEMFCIGTEFRRAIHHRPQFWFDLIKKVRSIYSGPLVYAANWDDFEDVPFWRELDFIGVNAYFPLTNESTPGIRSLKKNWQAPLAKIKALQRKMGKPVIFTEFGYLSVDGCAYKHWELEPKMREMEVNEQAQANAIQALFEVFWEEDWWAGGFLWKWFPNPDSHHKPYDWSYSPQEKQSADVVRNWYGRED